jgi:hypothetical protein
MGLLSTIGAASGRAFGLTRVSAAIRDAYFNLTTLLLPGDGTNGAQNNTFLDSSTNNFTITRNGNTTQGTFSPFSQTGWSNFFDGTGDYFTVPYSTTNFDWFTSGTDFTFEAWIYPTTLTGWSYSGDLPTLIGNMQATGPTNYWSFGPKSDGKVRLFYFNGGVITVDSTDAVNVNQWNHVAFTKTSSGIAIFVNGVGTTATAISGTPQSSTGVTLSIGSGNSTAINGYISNLRIVKGTAVYSGTTYTVPTAPLTDITNTKLLTCQANRFVDSSSVANTLTINGTPSVQAFEPFAPGVAYSAATVGGSGFFDGTGDYLNVASATALTFGTGDFTVEGWFYAGSLSGQPTLLNNGSDAGGLVITFLSSKIYAYFVGAGNVFGSGGATLVTNTWYHFAWVRSGSTNTFYLNGTAYGSTYSSAGNHSSTGGVGIGFSVAGTTFAAFNGYIADVRMVKGTAVYTANFTPPTAPLTAITNTSLLTNFTNAGITDATAKNDLETVGNAQISTTQSKFGGSSMYFDGTGDYLIPNAATTDLYAFGTGDFTIEMWVYAASVTAVSLYDSRPSGTNGAYLQIAIVSGQLLLGLNNTAILQAGTISTNTWTHLAVSRSGTSLRGFINGTQVGSTVTNSTSLLNAAQRPVIGTNGNTVTIENFNGYIDDLRVTKGYARYTSNFTAPTAAFPLS